MSPTEINAALRGLLIDLDLASPGERAHAERVAVYAVATGHALGLCDEELASVRHAALLHDIGKVRLDRATLRKLGTLTDEELAEMRRHADLSVGVIERNPAFAAALPGIRGHHERWDGSGYPDELEGEEIPMAARIIGVAEAFDVASFGAAWMPRLGTQVALELVMAGSGSDWDPRVLRAFLEIQPLIQPAGLSE